MNNPTQRRKRIYISGPIAGRVNFNQEAFTRRADELRAAGYEPINPHDVWPIEHTGVVCSARGRTIEGYDERHGKHNYGCFLAGDIVALATCDGISFLDDWELSPGATAEYYFARACAIEEVEVPKLDEKKVTS